MQKDSNSAATSLSTNVTANNDTKDGSTKIGGQKEEKKVHTKHSTLNLQNLAITVTTKLLTQLLNDKKVAFERCEVQISEESKQCEEGKGSIIFASKSELVSAAKSLKGVDLEGKPVDFQVPQSMEFSAQTTLFVGNLHEKTKEEDLIKEFSKFGYVSGCQVQKDKQSQRSKGFAFIDFENEEVAQKVIEQMNGKPKKFLTPHNLLVQPYENLKEKRAQYEQHVTKTKTNLFVDHLPVNYSEQDVTSLFSKFGKVVSVRIKRLNGYRNQNNLLPTTFHHQAYVNMSESQEAEAAIEGLNGKIIDLQTLRITYYEKSTNYQAHAAMYIQPDQNDIIDGVHYKILFVRGIPKNISQDDLTFKCKTYGDLASCQLKKYQQQGGPLVSRGIAIISFNNKNDAQKAQQGLYMDKTLGNELDIDYYRDKNLRMQDYEQRNNPFNQLIQGFNMQGPGGYSHRNQTGYFPMNTRIQSSFSGYPNSNPYYQQQSRGGFQYRINTQQSMNQRSSIPQQYQHQNRQRPKNSNRNPQYHQNSAQNNNYGQRKPYYNRNYQRPNTGNYHHQQRQGQLPGFPQQPLPVQQPGAMMPLGQQQNAQPVPQIVPAVQINFEEFNKLTQDQDRKSLLGNLMYPLIAEKDAAQAGKVTGMILEQPIPSILQICGNKDQFFTTVDQALNLIRSSGGNQQPQPGAQTAEDTKQ